MIKYKIQDGKLRQRQVKRKTHHSTNYFYIHKHTNSLKKKLYGLTIFRVIIFRK